MIAAVAAIATLAVLVAVLFIFGKDISVAVTSLCTITLHLLTFMLRVDRCHYWPLLPETPTQAAMLLDAPQLGLGRSFGYTQ